MLNTNQLLERYELAEIPLIGIFESVMLTARIDQRFIVLLIPLFILMISILIYCEYSGIRDIFREQIDPILNMPDEFKKRRTRKIHDSFIVFQMKYRLRLTFFWYVIAAGLLLLTSKILWNPMWLHSLLVIIPIILFVINFAYVVRGHRIVPH